MADQKQEDLGASLMRELECPVCLETCAAPIYQCVNGHNVCAACRQRMTHCGICRGDLATTRNFFAEDISAKMASLKLKTAEAEANRIYRCYCFDPTLPTKQCQWKGTLSQVFAHVTEIHQGYTHCGGIVDISTKMVYNIRNNEGMLYPKLVSFEGILFWCMIYYMPIANKVHIYARQMGGDTDEKFLCEFKLENGEQKLVYTQKPLKYDDEFRKGNKTLQLSEEMIDMFTVEGLINCEVRIFRSEGKGEGEKVQSASAPPQES